MKSVFAILFIDIFLISDVKIAAISIEYNHIIIYAEFKENIHSIQCYRYVVAYSIEKKSEEKAISFGLSMNRPLGRFVHYIFSYITTQLNF